MKKLVALNWSYIAVIALAVSLYLGSDELIVSGQSETAREALNAALEHKLGPNNCGEVHVFTY